MTEKIIKIIDVKKKIIDLATIDPDDLDAALNIMLESDNSLNKNIVYAFKDISINLQSQPYTLFSNINNIISINLRNLFTNKSLIPIIDSFGSDAFAESNENIYKTKLPNRTIAILNDTIISENKKIKNKIKLKNELKNVKNNNIIQYKIITLPAEEMVSITHILISKKNELMSLIDFKNNYLGYKTYLLNGSFNAWLLSYMNITKSSFNYNNKNYEKINIENLHSQADILTFKDYIGDNIIIPIDKYQYILKKNVDILLFSMNSTLSHSFKNINILPNINSNDSYNIINSKTIIKKPINYKTWMDDNERNILYAFIKKIYEIHNINYDLLIKYIHQFDMIAISELYKYNALNIYYYIISDNNNKKIQQFYLDSINTIYKINQKNIINKKLLEDNNKIKIYLLLIENKLGITRLHEITYNNIITSLDDLFSKLTEHEKEIIKNAYNNKLLLLKSFSENKCPHLKLCTQLRNSKNIQNTKKIIEQILAYAEPNKDEISWLMCKSCKYPLICPHVIDKINAECNNTQYNDTMAIMDKYINKIIYKGNNDNLFNYYCLICSEKIAETDYELSYKNTSKYGDINSDIKIKIWSILTNTMSFVEFDIIKNSNVFVNDGVNILYDIINKLGATRKVDLAKSIYQDNSEIDPLIHFYCVIFSYVYILYCIITNKNMTFKGIKSGSKISKYAEDMIKIINSKYSLLISQLNLKSEYINKKFIDAYQYISKNINIDSGDLRDKNELVYQTAAVDAMYRYAKKIIILTSKNKKIDDVDMFIQILGNTPEEFNDRAKKYLAFKHVFNITSAGKNLEFLMKGDDTNFYYKLYKPNNIPFGKIDELKKNSKKWFLNKIKAGGKKNKTDIKKFEISLNENDSKFDKFYIINKYTLAIYYESYNLFHEYITKIYSKDEYNKYVENINKFKQIENKIESIIKFERLNSYFYFKALKNSQYKKQDINYSVLYDENGLKHDWSIYCYEDEELTISEILKKDSWSDPILDVKCSICNIRKTNLKSLDEKKIKKSLQLIADFDLFFIFYQSRCPEGKLHNWENHECIKCKLKLKYITHRDSSSKEYYNKYYNIFKKMSNDSKYKFNIVDPIKIEDTNIIKLDKNIDFSYVVKVCKLFNIDINVFEAIGCMQFRSFEDIKSGKDKKDQLPIKSIEDERIYSADAEIRYLITMYSAIKHAETTTNIEILTFLEKLNISKYEYKNLVNYIPEIDFNDYNNKYNYIKKEATNNPEKTTIDSVFKFIIYHIAYFIILIADHKNKEHNESFIKTICLDFSKLIITNIIKNQKLLSRPLLFNWKYFLETNDEDDYVDEDEQVDNGGDIIIDPTDDIGIEPDNENNPFSAENIDYDLDDDEDNFAGVNF
jgi:hypothetical protein